MLTFRPYEQELKMTDRRYTQTGLIEDILKNGVDKVRFIIPIQCKSFYFSGADTLPAFIHTYNSKNAEKVECFCTVSESMYKLKDEYKITLVPQNNLFAPQDFYLSDLVSMLNVEFCDFSYLGAWEDKIVNIKKDYDISPDDEENAQFLGQSFEYTALNNENGPLQSINDEPAYKDTTGVSIWFENNLIHRENGFAAINHFKDGGMKIWMYKGQKHNENGPAVIYDDPKKEPLYFLNDVQYTKEEYEALQARKFKDQEPSA